MKKALWVILGIFVAASAYAASVATTPANPSKVKAINSAAPASPGTVQPTKAIPAPSVDIIKPAKGDIWQAGKSYDVTWESHLLSPGSAGTVTLTVMVPQSNCQPVNNVPLSGTISYKVPFASGQMGIAPHGKQGAMLSVKFIDKVSGKEYSKGQMIVVQYP